MTKACFFFFRNPLNVSSVKWFTSLGTSLQSFSGGGGGGGSFGLLKQRKKSIETFPQYKCYVRIQLHSSVNAVSSMVLPTLS